MKMSSTAFSIVPNARLLLHDRNHVLQRRSRILEVKHVVFDFQKELVAYSDFSIRTPCLCLQKKMKMSKHCLFFT